MGVKYYYFLPNFFTPLFKTGLSDNGFSCLCRLLPLGFRRFLVQYLAAQSPAFMLGSSRRPLEVLGRCSGSPGRVLWQCYGNAKAMLEIK